MELTFESGVKNRSSYRLIPGEYLADDYGYTKTYFDWAGHSYKCSGTCVGKM